jgi:hypothetical protein
MRHWPIWRNVACSRACGKRIIASGNPHRLKSGPAITSPYWPIYGHQRRSMRRLKAFRRRMVTRYRMATTAGHGPRYLHSTGQLHKGGPSQGMFLELTEPPSRDLKIPGAPYTFGTLAQAQAVGDVQSLQTHGRPVVHLALGRQPALHIQALLASTTQRGSRNAKRAQPKRERSRGRRA